MDPDDKVAFALVRAQIQEELRAPASASRASSSEFAQFAQYPLTPAGERGPELRSVCRFARLVMQARAEARGRAEQCVWKGSPLSYLKMRSGRERPGRPGWTDSTEVTGPGGGPMVVFTNKGGRPLMVLNKGGET